MILWERRVWDEDKRGNDVVVAYFKIRHTVATFAERNGKSRK